MGLFQVFIVVFFCILGSRSYANPACDEYSAYACAETSDFTVCDDKLIQKYTGNLYIPLNAHLRSLQVDESCKPLASSLIAAVLKLPPIRGKSFRGTKYREVLGTLKVGDCYSDLAFMSTSKDLTTAAYLFAPNADYVLFEIKAFSGRDISDHSQTHEEEILLLPNTILKLEAINSYHSKKLFKFTEVTSDKCSIVNH